MALETSKEYRSPAGMPVIRTVIGEFSVESEIVKTDELRQKMTNPFSASFNRFTAVEVKGGVWVASIFEPTKGVYYTDETTYDEKGHRRISAVDYTLNGKGGVRIDRHLHNIGPSGDIFGYLNEEDIWGTGKIGKGTLEQPYGLQGEVTIDEETQAPVLTYVEVELLDFKQAFPLLSRDPFGKRLTGQILNTPPSYRPFGKLY